MMRKTGLLILVVALSSCRFASPLADDDAPAPDAPTADSASTEPILEPVLEPTAEAVDDALQPTVAITEAIDAAVVDAEAQAATVATVRNVGTAMFSWLTDQVGAAPAPGGGLRVAAHVTWRPAPGAASARRGDVAGHLGLGRVAERGAQQTEGAGSTYDVETVPLITHEDLMAWLVPVYLAELPTTDGWGHDLEYRLNVADVLAQQVMAIRSPGRDGAFAATSYPVAAFAPNAFDEDIVWADGFFVRWPEQGATSE